MVKICVFCSSRNIKNPIYEKSITELGKLMGKRNDTLVYGGCRLGGMEQIAKSVQENGGKVIGIVPKAFLKYSKGDDKQIITEDLAERKKLFVELSDAIVIFPGGLFTLEEFFDIYSQKQLGEFNKPIIIININNFYQDLFSQLNRMCKEKFADESTLEVFSVVDNVNDALKLIDNYSPDENSDLLKEHKENLEAHKN